MKSVKRYVTFVLVIMLTLSFMTIGVFAEETTVVTVEKNVNLALHKAVECLDKNENSILLTDGLYNKTALSGKAEKDDTFTVDLGRYALITDIKLWPSQSGSAVSGNKMSDVALEVSMDNISWETVAVQGTVSETLSKESVFECSLEDGEYYRYVRVRKTQTGDYEFGELEVFADVNAIEVSRGKTVTADRESSAAPTVYSWSSVVDGNTSAYGWLVEIASSEEKCLAIDLGKETVADWIEMYARRAYAATSYRKDWEVYGLKEDESDYILAPKGNGTKLFNVTTTDTFDANYPANVEANDPNNHLYETLDGTESYRYFSFYKPQNLVGLAEIGIYTIIPEVANVEIDGTTLNVLFSEKMNQDTFDYMTVKIDGEEVMPDTMLSEDGYSAVFELGDVYYGAKVDVVVPSDVKSIRGLSVDATVETCYFPQAIEAEEPVFLNGKLETSTEITSLSGNTSAGVKMTFKNNQPEKAEEVIMVAVLYDENHTIIRMDEVKVTIEPGSEEKTLIAGFDLPTDTTGCTLSVFVWKEYRYMSPWFIHKSIS